jgi:ABC-2 type transport system ATP-binding protein
MVSIENISKLYGKQKALDDVSFNVNTSHVVGFLGPNGAGKSTMMKIIACFIPQTSGKALVCGFDVTEQPIEVKKKVGYLPENNPLYLDMYVKEYLGFIAGIHQINGSKEKRINEMIEITGLQEEYKKKIGALSKGFRQRVGLAQALIHKPEVLILDEPTSGLDPNQLIEIRNIIRELGKEKTVILSTHIMQEVEAICDRVIIINKGKIVADENTVVLQQTSLQNIVVVEFDKEVAVNQIQAILGVVKAQHIHGNTWKLAAEGKQDIRNNVFQFAVQNNFAVLAMNREEHSLEQIFQQLTKNINE